MVAISYIVVRLLTLSTGLLHSIVTQKHLTTPQLPHGYQCAKAVLEILSRPQWQMASERNNMYRLSVMFAHQQSIMMGSDGSIQHS